MTPTEKQIVKAKLQKIHPGKTYPSSVTIIERNDKAPFKDMPVKDRTSQFTLQSYAVGMYCCIHLPGQPLIQTGDHNNMSFVRQLKNNIRHALNRNVESIEIGQILPVETL